MPPWKKLWVRGNYNLYVYMALFFLAFCFLSCLNFALSLSSRVFAFEGGTALAAGEVLVYTRRLRLPSVSAAAGVATFTFQQLCKNTPMGER